MAVEIQIRSWLDTSLRASAAGDYRSMLPMLADDIVFLVPGAPPFGKKEFQQAWEGPMKGAKIESQAELEECLVAGDMAVTRTRLSVTITTADGKVSRAKGYTLSMFHEGTDGRWLLTRDANLLAPEE
jgi:uncharacterized protein (TIGR02246 family)